MIQSILPKTVAYPFSADISNEAENENHFHSDLELIFVLRGSITFFLGSNRYKIKAKDFVFANPYEAHAIQSVSDDGCYIHIFIQESRLRPLFSASRMMTFSWKETLNNRNDPFYQVIADAVRSIVIASSGLGTDFPAKAYQQVLRILIALAENCPPEKEEGNAGLKSRNQHQKSCEIMDYINSHFTEDISLNVISQALYLSPPYISKIFKESFHIGVLEYINRLRIQKSMVLLCSSNSYIADIAQECGFATANTFARIFQKETGVTPTDYRRLHADEEKDTGTLFSSSRQDYLPLLELGSDEALHSDAAEQNSSTSIAFDFTGKHIQGKARPWNKVIYAGTAELLLHHSAQETVKQAIKDFDAEYVRFVAPFADSLQSYSEDGDGNSHYFWSLLDEVLQFICDCHSKPFIALGYMPKGLAASAPPSPFLWNANTSAPKSYDKWADYLKAFFKHIVQLFSYEEVCTWKFEFWNDPAMDGIFWHESLEVFQKFFLISYRAFRAVLPDGQFGSPSFMYYDKYRQAGELLEFCKGQNIRLDFLCLHMYELTDPRNAGTDKMNRFIEHQISEHHGSQFVAESFSTFRAVAERTGFTVPIYITEWNVSPYSQDLSRDTAFMATYIMDTINLLPDAVESISFWSLSDYTTDFTSSQEIFTGELGMLTINHLPKSSYLAFKLLKRMKGHVLESGDGYCVTQSRHGYHIVLFNYSFYNQDYLNGISRPLSRKDRYQIFDSVPPRNFHLNLTLQSGKYRVERLVLDREHGSIYDGWVRMGAPEFLEKASLGYLNKIAYPEMNIQYKDVQGKLAFSEQIPQHGIILISLFWLGDV